MFVIACTYLNKLSMKIYRRPFWQANTSKVFIKMVIIAGVCLALLVYWATNVLWACLLFLFIWSFSLPMLFTQYFYVILTDDQLIFKNSIYTFWHKSYFFRDIAKIEIKPSINFYMKVLTKKRKTFVWDYVIDSVDPKDYDEIVNRIRAEGITVETAGFDTRYPNRNLHKEEKSCSCFNVDMEIFRQSLWNTSLVKMNLTFTVIVSTSFAPVILITTQSMWICLAFVLSCYALFPIYFIRHFYVVLFPDKLVIKNGVYSFMQKEYYFADIMKIKIERKKNIYMQVFTKTGEERVSRYCIDVVAPKDYGLLVEMIKLKGILVEIEGLDVHL